MRTRGRKLLLLLLLITVGAVVRERRASSQIQVADFPAPAPAPAPVRAETPKAVADVGGQSAADGDDDLSQPFTVAPSGPGDDLKKIKGVGPKLESMLHDQGITTFAQLAELTDADIERLDARLTQFPGRIRRDDWVAQAQALSAG